MSKTGKDSLLGNKIAAGLLAAGLVFWGANRIANSIVPDSAPSSPAIKLIGLAVATVPKVASIGLPSIIPLLASADISKGSAFMAQQCAACHTYVAGGGAGVGPNLYGVLGGPMFGTPGFTYSSAVTAKAKGDWNYDNINAWLADPQKFAPGTAMSYPGIKNTQARADVVAYLRTLSAKPLPLPTAAQVKAASAPSAAPAVASATPAAPPPAPGMKAMFASANVSNGDAFVQQQCAACHTLAKGAGAQVGPDLYGIVGAKSFSQPGFTYSSAVQAKAGKVWTPDLLSQWLTDPQAYAPGTAMSYPGIKDAQTRADVIAYLNQNSGAPVKLP